jgi:YbbR domain-containing protein
VRSPLRFIKWSVIFRGWTDNLGLKAFALVASIVLFSLVHSEEDAQRSVFLDVVALLPPPESETMLIGTIPDQVKVTLRGNRSRINGIQRDELPTVQIDLTDTKSHYYYFDPSSIKLPVTVNVVRIEPAAFPLTWAKKASRKVPVKPRITGSTGTGYSVRQPVVVIPSEITIVGPQSEIKSITNINTSLIVLDGMEPGKHERRVPLEPLPNNVTAVEDSAVKVELEIAAEVAERTLVRLEIAAVGESNVVFRPSRVAVTLRGPRHILQDIDPEQLVPYVEIPVANATLGATPQRVKLRGVPEDVEVVRISPSDVLVKKR